MLLPALFGLIASSAPAQQTPVKFRHLTIDDGLSQSAVYALLQDRQGFIWIGTKDGLNRYDGYHFIVYKTNPSDSSSLSNNFITALFEDSRGYIWVGTLEGGVNRFDPMGGQFQRYTHAPERAGSLSNNRISSIVEDHFGGIWIATDNGLNHLSAGEIELSQPTFEKLFHDPDRRESLSHNIVKTLLIDWQGELWVGTQNGLNRLSPAARGPSRWLAHYTGGPESDSGLMDESITSLFESRDSTLWAGTVSGVNRFRPEDNTFQAFPHHFLTFRRGWGDIRDFIEDDSGRLWLTTPNELMIFDPLQHTYQSIRSEKLNPAALNSNHLTKIMRDRSGVIWVGTNGYGLNLHDPKAERFFTYRRPKNFTSRIDRFSITAVMEDKDGILWISADVLYRWNRRSGELKSFETDSRHPQDFGNTGSWAIFQDHDGFLWFGGFEGLYRYDPQTGQARHFTRSSGLKDKIIFRIFSDRKGRLWLASENYISRFEPASEEFTHFRYRERPTTRFVAIADVYEHEDGTFWLATDDGLVHFAPQTGDMSYFRHHPGRPGSLSNNVVLAITADPDDADILWLGTAGGGLNRFRLSDTTFKAFTEEAGLPNNVVYAALPDRAGNLWLSTNKGLSRFNRAAGVFRNFDVSDRLQSNEFNTGAYFLSQSGEMFFGGIKGLSYFYPEQIIDNPHIPNVMLTDMRLFNQVITPQSHTHILDTLITHKKQVVLSHRDNVIGFEFAALDFSAPQRNQFAFRMHGFDERWINAGHERIATYTNLPAGEYIFQVRGSNNDGIWNARGVTLAVQVLAPPWKTWWAYALYLLAALGLLYGFRRYEMNRIFLKNRLQMEQIEGSKLREIDQLKSRFFANISHEFRTPLTLILGPIEQLIEKQTDEATKHGLRLMQRNATRLLSLINQLLDLARLESGKMEIRAVRADFMPFIRGLVHLFRPRAAMQGVRLNLHSDLETVFLYFERDKLEKVFHNLLANALQYVPRDGEVTVTVRVTDENLSSAEDGRTLDVMVSDTGPGIAEEHLPLIFDRFYRADAVENEGTGIGLALARELVELHHGQISVQSAPDEGSTFTVSLLLGTTHFHPKEIIPPGPFAPKAAPATEPSELVRAEIADRNDTHDTQQAKADKSDPAGREIILIVDDNAELRTYLRMRLQQTYHVVEAKDGESGIKTALETIPSLIVSDVMMPKLDGYALCRALKTDTRTSHIPVILLTARAEQQDKLAGLETGADDYLTKPFDSVELAARVENLIALRRTLRERFSTTTTISPREVSTNSMDQQFLEKIIEAVEAHLSEENLDVETLCRNVAMSERQLRRKMTALINQSPARFIRSYRLQRARQLLQQGAGTVSDIAFEVGFGSTAYFSKCFREQFGMKPSECRNSVQKQENANTPKGPGR